MKRREFRLEVEGYRTNALSWGDELNDLRTGEVIHAVETFDGDVVLSKDEAHDVRFAMEQALSDFLWVEKNVPGSNFKSSILLLKARLEILDRKLQ